MNTRKDFLQMLFRSLDANGISYCVLRNYEGLLEEGVTADIDLLVERRDLDRFSETLRTAASESGHRFVHHARYVNHSCVFWSPQSNFTRVDFDTEIRWRLFPILSARAILEARQRCGEFYIPHPRHESVVLFAQALWMEKLDERYRVQLARLYDVCENELLTRTYRKAFGSAGNVLEEFHAQVLKREFTKSFCSSLKRSLIFKTFAHPSTGWPDFAGNVIDDGFRLWERLRRPAGISLLYVTSVGSKKNLDALMHRVEFLFPAQKCFQHAVDLTQGRKPVRWGMSLELRRLRALFKGGLCVQFYQLAQGADISAVTKAASHRLYTARCFICTEDSNGRACLTHVGTGFQAGTADVEKSMKTDFSALLIGFISTVLEKENRRGIFGRKLARTAL
ncbi:MAG TPA: hypothetical protein VG754_10500 [Verrucomicrobiae bacterium]|nr:hypothetical protein [Verrucomicrobiae bacterium]